MPEFAHPWLLTCLILVPFAIWFNQSRSIAALRYPSIRGFAALPQGRAWVVSVSRFIRLGIAVCLVVALSGPRVPDRKTRVPTEGIAVLIVLDMSGSMFTESFTWEAGAPPISRNEAAKRAFRLFVAGGDSPDGTHFEGRATERGTDAIGLVTFTNWPYPVCPPTLNHSVLLHLLEDSRRPGPLEEGSNIGDAIVEALIRLEKSDSPRKVIILLSDGEHNFDRDEDDRKPRKPAEAAAFAANLGIPIYTIDTGGDPDPTKPDEIQQREAGREINRDIAQKTGGRAFTANEGSELLTVCKEIDRLERQPILSHSYRRYREWFPWLVGIGLALAISLFILEQTVWRRIP